MDKIQSKFKGIFIPEHIWNHSHLSNLDKLVWAILESEDRAKFNVEDTAKFLSISPEKVLNSVGRLFELKLLREVRYV